MDKNISKYLKTNPPDAFVKKFMSSGVADFEVVSKHLSHFSDYLSNCLKFLANDSDTQYTLMGNIMGWLVGFKANLDGLIKNLKEAFDKQFQSLKSLYEYIQNILNTLKSIRDLLVILQLIAYVSSSSELSYSFSASELSNLSVNVDSKVGAYLISRVGQKVDLLQLFKDYISPLNAYLLEMSTILNIDKSSRLLAQSLFKQHLISFEESMSQTTDIVIEVNSDLLANTFVGSEPLTLEPNLPITPQLAFKEILSPKAYTNFLDSSITQVINTIYG